MDTIESVHKHAREWLFNVAAPLWAGAGVLADGMFAERLDLLGAPVALPRRTRVQARQIYSFCTIGRMGWTGPWRAVVERALDILLTKGRRDDGLFVHLFDEEGEVKSQALDLYDHAFMLFALAHAADALQRPELMTVAAEVRDIMMRTWWRPEGGFWEGELTPCPPYRQNPHMHMFEAALAGHAASKDADWRELADTLGALFRERFQDRTSGAVTEYFHKDWTPVDGQDGRIVEPGHCLEWAWLFEVGFPDGSGIATSDALTAFARRTGINPAAGVAINEVYTDGTVKDGGARLWPQTERLKAAVARFHRLGTAEERAEVVAAYNGLWLYLDMPVAGTWRDRLAADGEWLDEASPASSFYHIVCALNELNSLG